MAASWAVGAEAGLAMDDAWPQRPLGGVVGGLDVRARNEGPERGLDGEEVLGEGGDLGNAQGGKFMEDLPDLDGDPRGSALEV